MAPPAESVVLAGRPRAAQGGKGLGNLGSESAGAGAVAVAGNGGAGGDGGDAFGGGLSNGDQAAASFLGVTVDFTNNAATGARGGNGGGGGDGFGGDGGDGTHGGKGGDVLANSGGSAAVVVAQKEGESPTVAASPSTPDFGRRTARNRPGPLTPSPATTPLADQADSRASQAAGLPEPGAAPAGRTGKPRPVFPASRAHAGKGRGGGAQISSGTMLKNTSITGNEASTSDDNVLIAISAP